MTTFDESNVRRDGAGQFAEQGRSAPVDLPAKPAVPSLYLTVRPEYWNGDYATEAGPSESFDVGPILVGLRPEEREEWLDVIRTEDSMGLERLYEVAAERGLVTPGFGPFSVRVDSVDAEEAADQWEANAPAPWTQDGVTPHPTGGYVTVDVDMNGTTYRDADGKAHREDGPAFEGPSGSFHYYRHGVSHRADGPATCVVSSHGNGSEVTQSWYVDGDYVGTQQTMLEPDWSIRNGVPRRTS